MPHPLEALPPVRRGTWLYAGATPCEVRIVRHDVWYGSGDSQDPPEIAEDREVECFYLLYHTPIGLPEWVGGGATLTLAEAIAHAETLLGESLVWHNP